jgi:hypothetical protein
MTKNTVYDFADLSCPLLLVKIKRLISQHYDELPFSCLVGQHSVIADLHKIEAKLMVKFDSFELSNGILLNFTASNGLIK